MTSSGRIGRAASCTSAMRASSGISATPARTESARVAPPGHRRVHLAGVELLGEQDGRLLPFLRHDDHDRVDPLGGLEALEALGEKHALPEPRERLRPVAAEPLSAAGRDQDRPGAHCGSATSCPLRSSKSSGLSGFFPVVNSCRTLPLITGA